MSIEGGGVILSVHPWDRIPRGLAQLSPSLYYLTFFFIFSPLFQAHEKFTKGSFQDLCPFDLCLTFAVFLTYHLGLHVAPLRNSSSTSLSARTVLG
jgi:hypothetical protein